MYWSIDKVKVLHISVKHNQFDAIQLLNITIKFILV